MDAMYSAIKNRRGGGLLDESEAAPEQADESGVGLEGLVKALSADQKSQLLALAVGNGGAKAQGALPQPKGASEIEKGAMGPGEEAEIEESLGGEHESEDDIAESMMSSSDKMRSARGDKPRNLGERMKFDLAKKKQK